MKIESNLKKLTKYYSNNSNYVKVYYDGKRFRLIVDHQSDHFNLCKKCGCVLGSHDCSLFRKIMAERLKK